MTKALFLLLVLFFITFIVVFIVGYTFGRLRQQDIYLGNIKNSTIDRIGSDYYYENHKSADS